MNQWDLGHGCPAACTELASVLPPRRLVLACENGVLGKGSGLGSREEVLYLTYYCNFS